MNAEEFAATSIALLRGAVGWQSAIARKLDVQPRQVRRWIAAGKTPDWVDAKLAEMTGQADISPWPRGEWLIGDAVGGDGRHRKYIYHMQPPRFIARIVACGADWQPLPEEQPADIASGVSYSIGQETVLCEVDWIEPVATGEVEKWLEAAGDEIEALDDGRQP